MRLKPLLLLTSLLLCPSAFALDTGFKSPTVSGTGGWITPDNAFSSNDVDATDGGLGNEEQIYESFAISIPGGSTINGLEVTAEGAAGFENSTLGIELSYDGGTSWTTQKTDVFSDGADQTKTYGGSADTWGRTWAVSEFSNANFKLRADFVTGSLNILVDHIQVKIYYSSFAVKGNGVVFVGVDK